ncbi:hypothetical protein D3C87_1731180 [compost metagenome]
MRLGLRRWSHLEPLLSRGAWLDGQLVFASWLGLPERAALVQEAPMVPSATLFAGARHRRGVASRIQGGRSSR